LVLGGFFFGIRILDAASTLEAAGVLELPRIVAERTVRLLPALVVAAVTWMSLELFHIRSTITPNKSCNSFNSYAKIISLSFLWQPTERQCAPWTAPLAEAILSSVWLGMVALAAARFGLYAVDTLAALYEGVRQGAISLAGWAGWGRSCRSILRRLGCGPLGLAHVRADLGPELERDAPNNPRKYSAIQQPGLEGNVHVQGQEQEQE